MGGFGLNEPQFVGFRLLLEFPKVTLVLLFSGADLFFHSLSLTNTSFLANLFSFFSSPYIFVLRGPGALVYNADD